MSTGKKRSEKPNGVNPQVLDAARCIAELKDESLEELEAQFFTNYVTQNLSLLTEKARTFMHENEVKTDG